VEALPGLGHLQDVVLGVARLVFLSGVEVGQQLGEEAERLLLVHLLEVGHPLAVHETLLSSCSLSASRVA
jgi:hypothetical protein